MKKLAPRQLLFVHEYLLDFNGTQAAIRAGYSRKTANEQAAQLLAKLNIKKLVRIAINKRKSGLIMTREETLQELTLIGRSDIQDYFRIDEGGAIIAKSFEEMPKGASRALESIEENRTIRESSDGKESNIVNDKIKFKLHSKTAALESLAKHHGIYEKDNKQREFSVLKVVYADGKGAGE